MPKKIIWSPLAENDFEGILSYLAVNWNNEVANKFIDLTEKHLNKVSINPKQYPIVYSPKKIRKCVLTKHNSLYYREYKKRIELLRIFDTRQDPKKLTFV